MIKLKNSLTLLNQVNKLILSTSTVVLSKSYSKKAPAPTEAELQAQKFKTERGLRKKSSLKETPYNFQDVSTSIEYVNSEAFKLAYGTDPVWVKYVRNFGGHIKPQWTRSMCIRAGKYATGSPCPVCRDEFLVVHYKNIKLLKQFISESTGEIIAPNITNVCQKTQFNLKVAYAKAVDFGLIERYVPHVAYDYSMYYDDLKKKVQTPSILLNIISAARLKDTNKILTDLTDQDVLSINKS